MNTTQKVIAIAAFLAMLPAFQAETFESPLPAPPSSSLTPEEQINFWKKYAPELSKNAERTQEQLKRNEKWFHKYQKQQKKCFALSEALELKKINDAAYEFQPTSFDSFKRAISIIKSEIQKRIPADKIIGEPYIQKIDNLPLNTQFIIIGDIHGYKYSFLKLIKTLEQLGFLSDGILQNEIYLCFTGDFVDRGPLSREILIEFAQLIEKNPNKIFICRGNHEDLNLNKNNGFAYELKNTFSETQVKALIEPLSELYKSLPSAIYVSNKQKKVMQISHGTLPVNRNGQLLSIEKNISLEDFLLSERTFANISPAFDLSLRWSDFTKEINATKSHRNIKVYKPSISQTYEQALSINLLGVIHGHTHPHENIIESINSNNKMLISPDKGQWTNEKVLGLKKCSTILNKDTFFNLTNVLQSNPFQTNGSFLILSNESDTFTIDAYQMTY